VSIYSTFFTAENISDLSNLDGTVHVTIGPGNWNTTGAFWDGSPAPASTRTAARSSSSAASR
jgi:hypothetical protein